MCFFNFSKFWFSRFSGEWRGKKWSKITKNSVYHSLHLKNLTSYDFGFCYICVKWWYLQQFLSFLFWFFGFLARGGGSKRVKNNHKIYLFQSATIYILETANDIIKIFGTLAFFIGAHQQFFYEILVKI